MLLLRTLPGVLSALVIAAIVFTLECNAVRGILPVYGEDNSIVHPPNPPATNFGRASTSAPSLTLDSFITQLSPLRIDRLQARSSSYYHQLPLHQNVPIINIQSGGQLVEQALKDYGTVVLVDSINRKVKRIDFQTGQFIQHDVQNPNKVLLLSSLDPNVHTLRRHLQHVPEDPHYPITMPSPVNTDHLPHLEGVPVLPEGHDTLGHMLYASVNGEESFWLVKHVRMPVEVRPNIEDYVAEAGSQAGDRIRSLLTNYAAARNKYSSAAMAGLLHGKKISVDPNLRDQRVDSMRQNSYLELTQGASRSNMINALQQYGQFHYYDMYRTSTGPFKVKLDNYRVDAPDAHMSISVRELHFNPSTFKAIADKFRRFRV
ncbi:uncharacterized protein SRS1_11240 [Sporisorium reilianum f. sp. reilianum]|uniref:Uncharacterized protein n=1 Tax=Sporisorium reilianum f. sp. reilianum TaxID=72559 RepID=A0A2N8UGV7_9BASI|nr:uncharacterized protein SRS1_11240 [Sporisorium reilianum f. sp. reilianum]